MTCRWGKERVWSYHYIVIATVILGKWIGLTTARFFFCYREWVMLLTSRVSVMIPNLTNGSLWELASPAVDCRVKNVTWCEDAPLICLPPLPPPLCTSSISGYLGYDIFWGCCWPFVGFCNIILVSPDRTNLTVYVGILSLRLLADHCFSIDFDSDTANPWTVWLPNSPRTEPLGTGSYGAKDNNIWLFISISVSSCLSIWRRNRPNVTRPSPSGKSRADIY